ncbi:MAG: N-acetylmuramoyl-L-alanine amidase, partial [Proteobacteria bacterium]|nr:N-acetylmuramoyl-L-alanine amidase [Pseudomonadota bacterium]
MKILSSLCLLSLMIPSASASEIEGMRVWTGPDNTRAVFDLSQSTEYKLFELDNPPRVVIDFESTSLNKKLSIKDNKDIKNVRFSTKTGKQVRVVLDLKQKLKPKSFLLKPAGNYGHRLVVDLSHNVKVKPKVVSQISKPNRDVIIALDAGHGGEDPGAIGPKGTKEKVVTLNIANKLAQLINKQKGMTALIIRNGDYYIEHRKRVEKARENQADLFIS